ncbi:serine hydrolase [Rummeliibacillus sp. JY-2-4R]
MRKQRKIFIVGILMMFAVLLFQPLGQTSAVAKESFNDSLSKELNNYIKKTGGDIAIEYNDLATNETFKMKSTKGYMAASTIKLPLALYVIELADKKKLNLSQKLTYKSYHYVGGSGVIQYQKVGTKYTIKDLVHKAMKYSDNIAFNMLKERVGETNFVKYMRNLGASNSTPNALRYTSTHDLVIYANRLYQYSKTSKNGKMIVDYLQHTIYNSAIPAGIKGGKISHKVGMMPIYKVSHDYGIVYGEDPYILAVMTKGFTYERSNHVIAGIASIVNKHHQKKLKYIKTSKDTVVYKSQDGKTIIATLKKGEIFRFKTMTNSKWLGIQIGSTTGYIKNDQVTKYTKSPKEINHTNRVMNGAVMTIAEANVLDNGSTKATTFATISKGTRISVAKVNKTYYCTTFGTRVGYIKASDLKTAK